MTEYINKQKLIKAIEDKRPLNWNDTEAELAEQRAYDDIIGSIEGFNEEESDRINELMEADKEGRCLVLPCKVGDTVYRIQEAQLKENCKKARFVRSVILNKHNFWRIIFGGEFGEKVFLTKEKAEKALEGLE